MLPDTARIVTARIEDVDRLSDALTAAFFSTPDVVWALPDPQERAAVMHRYVPALLRHCLHIGEVHTTEQLDAAALWWPHDALDPEAYHGLVQDSCGEHAGAVLQLGAILADHEPAEAHQYLAYIGVAPDRQNIGIGAALLRHHHAALDAANTAAYLVASTEGSRDLYERHGYTAQPGGPVRLPADGPPLWPMWRPVRRAGVTAELAVEAAHPAHRNTR